MKNEITKQNISHIDVVILCGGKGTRLQKVINDRPKPMAQINEKPFLDIIINLFKNSGFKRFILCTGHKAEFISDYYAQLEDDVEIVISKENEPLGTAGAVKNAEDLIRSQTFMVVNGDSFCPVKLNELLAFHIRKKASLSITVVESDKTKEVGLIKLDESFRIRQFSEKTKVSGKAFTNAGIYIFEKQILSNMPKGKKISLEYDIFPCLVDSRCYGFVTNQGLIDIGTPERLKKARNMLGDT